MNYYQRTEFVSNSELTAFKKTINLVPEQDLQGVYDFGSLVDAIITEEKEIGTFQQRVSVEQMETAELMAMAAKEDQSLAMFLNAEDTRYQYEIYRKQFRVEYEGDVVFLPFKMKLDLLRRSFKAGADIKTTACSSLPSFINAIEFFDYDRQGFTYMEGAGLDYFTFIGISKKKNRITRKYDVYKFAMQRDDETFKRGKSKFNYLAYKYYHLIHTLKL